MCLSTFLLQGQGKSVISVALTGIASLFLIDGQTYHSQFKIYQPIDDKSTSNIRDNDYEAAQLAQDILIAD